MASEPAWWSIAESAYAAYRAGLGGRCLGRPMPDWDRLDERARIAWHNAVVAVACGLPPMTFSGPAEPSYTCPRCGMTSHHPGDVRNSYCGNCHRWHGTDEV